jgi:hypothetical protein
MYQEVLQAIATEKQKYDLSLQPPCSAADLERLRDNSVQELQQDIPAGYEAFLQATNGLDWNGLQVFATHRTPIAGFTDRFIGGFVDENLRYRDFEPMKQFLVFAGDGTVLHVFDTVRAEYQVILAVGLTVLETASSFEELIQNALRGTL